MPSKVNVWSGLKCCVAMIISNSVEIIINFYSKFFHIEFVAEVFDNAS